MKRRIQNAVGIAAVVLLVILAGLIFFGNEKAEEEKGTKASTGTILFDSEELVFDGTGKLDLMKGVSATDSEGNSVTDKVEALITGDGSTGRKSVRYSFSDTTGQLISKKRTLVMKNYDGPSLSVMDELSLEAEDLKNLVNILADNGSLKAEDGYGRDITTDVRCIREKKENGQYTMTFSVVNAYGDSETVSVTAYIKGNAPDPEIRLSETEITLRRTEYFDPMKYVVFSSDGVSENVSDKIETDSSVDTSVSGNYRVVYRLYSADKTAFTTKVLKVKVDI